MAAGKVLVAGATGLVGNAALRHFGRVGGAEVVALSRRRPRELYGARHVAVDLTVSAQCTRAATELQGATHLIYAALYETANLVDGWRDPRHPLADLAAAVDARLYDLEDRKSGGAPFVPTVRAAIATEYAGDR